MPREDTELVYISRFRKVPAHNKWLPYEQTNNLEETRWIVYDDISAFDSYYQAFDTFDEAQTWIVKMAEEEARETWRHV